MCTFVWHWITSTKDTSTAITHATWLKVTTVLHRITYANRMYSFSRHIYATRLCYMLCHTVRDQSLNKRNSNSLQFTFINYLHWYLINFNVKDNVEDSKTTRKYRIEVSINGLYLFYIIINSVDLNFTRKIRISRISINWWQLIGSYYYKH